MPLLYNLRVLRRNVVGKKSAIHLGVVQSSSGYAIPLVKAPLISLSLSKLCLPVLKPQPIRKLVASLCSSRRSLWSLWSLEISSSRLLQIHNFWWLLKRYKFIQVFLVVKEEATVCLYILKEIRSFYNYKII